MLPFGTVVTILGYGRVVVRDKGDDIKGQRLDVMFATHAEAEAWGVQYLDVQIGER